MFAVRSRIPPSLLTFCACLLGLSLTISGCGPKDWKAKTVPAKGTLTINGEAPDQAMVELVPIGTPPDARNSRAWGVVKLDGTYELSTYKLGDGVPPGDYAVIVSWPWELTAAVPVDRLHGAYSDPEKSEWKVTITQGENMLPPIAIENVKIEARSKRRPAGP